jgi:hypothetical protein
MRDSKEIMQRISESGKQWNWTRDDTAQVFKFKPSYVDQLHQGIEVEDEVYNTLELLAVALRDPVDMLTMIGVVNHTLWGKFQIAWGKSSPGERRCPSYVERKIAETVQTTG